MIRSIWQEWKLRSGDLSRLGDGDISSIKDFVRSVETSPAEPIVSFVTERLVGKFIPVVSALSIWQDARDLATWVEEKHPGFFTGVYQGSMDRMTYESGETDPDMYYDPDVWLRKDVQERRFAYARPKRMDMPW